jgi:CheY-like chemotaxis protein
MQRSNDLPTAASSLLPWPRQYNVLIVDEHADEAELLQTLFEFEGHVAVTAQSGEDAVELANSRTFDIAYLDLKLNGTNGYALAEKLRQLSALSEIPFVAMSGTDHRTDGELELLHEFDYFLLKPVGIQQFLQPLKELAEQS